MPPLPPSGSQSSSFNDPAMRVVFGVIAAFVAVWFVYTANKAVINQVLVTINQGLLYPFALFFSDAAEARRLVAAKNPKDIPWSGIVAQYRVSGGYLRWLIAPLFVWLGIRLVRISVALTYHRKLKLKELMRAQSKVFPYMRPVVDLNLEDLPQHAGPWRSTEQPIQWVMRHGLLVNKTTRQPIDNKKFKLIHDDGRINYKARFPLALYEPDRDRTLRALEEQLGGPFPGYARLKNYQKGVAAALLAFGHGDREMAYALLDRMAISVTEKLKAFTENKATAEEVLAALDIGPETRKVSGKPKQYLGAAELIAKYGNTPEFRQFMGPHLYWSNVFFMRLKQFAMERGIIEPAHFTWLRPMDRTFFYTILQTSKEGIDVLPYTEACAVQAHKEAEAALGRRIETPEINAAWVGLRKALFDESWTDDDPLPGAASPLPASSAVNSTPSQPNKPATVRR